MRPWSEAERFATCAASCVSVAAPADPDEVLTAAISFSSFFTSLIPARRGSWPAAFTVHEVCERGGPAARAQDLQVVEALVVLVGPELLQPVLIRLVREVDISDFVHKRLQHLVVLCHRLELRREATTGFLPALRGVLSRFHLNELVHFHQRRTRRVALVEAELVELLLELRVVGHERCSSKRAVKEVEKIGSIGAAQPLSSL